MKISNKFVCLSFSLFVLSAIVFLQGCKKPSASNDQVSAQPAAQPSATAQSATPVAAPLNPKVKEAFSTFVEALGAAEILKEREVAQMGEYDLSEKKKEEAQKQFDEAFDKLEQACRKACLSEGDLATDFAEAQKAKVAHDQSLESLKKLEQETDTRENTFRGTRSLYFETEGLVLSAFREFKEAVAADIGAEVNSQETAAAALKIQDNFVALIKTETKGDKKLEDALTAYDKALAELNTKQAEYEKALAARNAAYKSWDVNVQIKYDDKLFALLSKPVDEANKAEYQKLREEGRVLIQAHDAYTAAAKESASAYDALTAPQSEYVKAFRKLVSLLK